MCVIDIATIQTKFQNSSMFSGNKIQLRRKELINAERNNLLFSKFFEKRSALLQHN